LANVVLFGEVDEIDNRLCGEEEQWVDDFDLGLRVSVLYGPGIAWN
jgi:hypothetical protein